LAVLKILGCMRSELEILEVEKRIRTRVNKQMGEPQKEYYLNEQMRAIRKELGEKDEFKDEIEELEDKLREKKMSAEAREKCEREVKKLKMMSPMFPEATVVRNYLDWFLSLPWYEYTEANLDIKAAQRILEEDHHGVDKVKQRILEYLAVQTLVGQIKGPILCLVGPPGVGKTSLGRSIARAMGRKFVRMSLGGVHDEAEIRGHRRTYIGALPGKIIQSMCKAGSGNPVFLLDEVDKMSTDFRGDLSSALLEVLDPEQNCAFDDHYLDVDYDLSKVLFITTANTSERIPRSLQDRMEVIRIPGYTENEKLSIAKRYLLKKQREANGLKEENIEFSEKATLGTNSSLSKYLGPPRFRYGLAETKPQVGVATDLAWTELGGELLSVEVTIAPGRGKLTVTGQLGDVMRESAHAALSYVRSRATALGLDPNFYQKSEIHIHLPEGAVPKDGPSAGITLATALVSALCKVPVRNDLAMTGEITLRGRVLPIGGLKEKALAAHRGGIKIILIPKDNEKDVLDIPSQVLKNISLVQVEHMDDVIKRALVARRPETTRVLGISAM
jgi:ATP-dependent Lon protease